MSARPPTDLPGRVLALDWGERRIGLAVCDALRITAAPLGVIERRDEAADLGRLAALIAEERCVEVVIGLPRNADGSSGATAARALAFARALQARTPVPLAMVDETYSSLEADELLRTRIRDPRKRRARRDAMAATVILRTFLEHGGSPLPAAGEAPEDPPKTP